MLAAFTLNELTPFVFSLQPGQRHALYHGPLKSQSDINWPTCLKQSDSSLAPLTAMPDEISVINVFSLGSAKRERSAQASPDEPHLVAYSGIAIHEREMGEHAPRTRSALDRHSPQPR
ncbi:MAG: hypothetical protein CM15mP125_1640 [Gammaproteobacteria bacterium]|nr:MAG: hypothetical protein CM15mP125_1640 [Gammaproteobacteria bacterium]